ncbi:hypothetical protein [Dysgonomonas sp. ZJ279]|uniref:hypothetical protein n=1 Tax=Dysgonomonas sp. ZJ279 TaxID=2709796 RepID=UPI0013EA0B97|nr:hypothetical protein [Dysgonomonas sp. ZJ279]
MSRGILLDNENELTVANGTLKIADCTIQDAFTVLSINQGELKEDPIAGVNLEQMIRARFDREKIKKAVEIGLERVGVRYEDIKEQIDTIINGESR